jgi:hypothetical protein
LGNVDNTSDANKPISTATQTALNAIVWKNPVIDFFNPTSALPVTPATGDRYIASATANDWTINNIYEYDGSDWVETVATIGLAVYETTDTNIYIYSGSAWVAVNRAQLFTTSTNNGTLTFASSTEWSTSAASTRGYEVHNTQTGFEDEYCSNSFRIDNTLMGTFDVVRDANGYASVQLKVYGANTPGQGTIDMRPLFVVNTNTTGASAGVSIPRCGLKVRSFGSGRSDTYSDKLDTVIHPNVSVSTSSPVLWIQDSTGKIHLPLLANNNSPSRVVCVNLTTGELTMTKFKATNATGINLRNTTLTAGTPAEFTITIGSIVGNAVIVNPEANTYDACSTNDSVLIMNAYVSASETVKVIIDTTKTITFDDTKDYFVRATIL